ncbi:MAG: septation protein SepH, partial [Acidimicrobiia bacterium]
MLKLHLVGISADRRGLVLSDDPRGSKTELVLEVDQALLSAIAELRRLQTLDTAALSPALPTRRDSSAPSPTGSFHSLLAPREIQQRLRRGVAVETVAAEAGVDKSWVERFAAPVAAEQARVVAQARRATYLRPRLGASAEPLDASVITNALERGARLGLAEVEAGWTAFQRDDGKWTVRFTFEAKGRSQAAEWDFAPSTAELSARNLLASELGHRAVSAPSARPKAKSAAAKPAPAKPTASG